MDPLALSTAKQRLLDQLHNLYDDLKGSDTSQVVRCEVEVNDITAMQWLACQSAPIKTYWANRNQEFKMAGVGIAHEISGQNTPIEEANRLLSGPVLGHTALLFHSLSYTVPLQVPS